MLNMSVGSGYSPTERAAGLIHIGVVEDDGGYMLAAISEDFELAFGHHGRWLLTHCKSYVETWCGRWGEELKIQADRNICKRVGDRLSRQRVGIHGFH